MSPPDKNYRNEVLPLSFQENLDSKEEIENNKDISMMYSTQPITMEESIDQGLFYAFLKILIKYGQLGCVISYGIECYTGANGKLNYYIRRTRIGGMFRSSIYALILLHMTIHVISYDFNVTYSKLLNTIKRTTHSLFVMNLVVVLYCAEHKGRNKGIWIKILEQADLIQMTFKKFGIKLPQKSKMKILGRLVCIISLIFCVVHILVFAFGKTPPNSFWYENHAKHVLATFTLTMGQFNVTTMDPTLAKALGATGIIMDIVCWHTWYIIDAIRVFPSLIMWIVFQRINSALKSGKLNVENLPDIMDIHFHGTKLLNLFNELISPLTFASTLFNTVYICFWTNYALLSFEFSLSHAVGILTFVRMVFVFYIAGEVNTQAYKISTWLENNFTELDTLSGIHQTKLALFSTIIYNREAIGFQGLNFFTVTPALNSTIAGLVLTYTVVVNQFATH